jgi:hypothetical protein
VRQGSSKQCAPALRPPKQKFGGLLWASIPLKAEGRPDFGLEFSSWAANESGRWRGLLPPQAEHRSPIEREFRFIKQSIIQCGVLAASANVDYSWYSAEIPCWPMSADQTNGSRRIFAHPSRHKAIKIRFSLSSAVYQGVAVRRLLFARVVLLLKQSYSHVPSYQCRSSVLRYCVRQSTRIVCMHTASHSMVNRVLSFDCVA